MTVYLFSARKLALALSREQVPARQQLVYLVVSFLVWTVPFYLYLIPNPKGDDPTFLRWLWLLEFFFVALIYVSGINYCLRQCRVDPKRNFLVDFSCLYAPVALTTLLGVWGAFHLVTTAPLLVLHASATWHDVLWLFPWLYSSKAYDLLRFFAYVGTMFVIFLRVGEWMSYTSGERESANSLLQPTGEEQPAAE
jgi:hypothetical protein